MSRSGSVPTVGCGTDLARHIEDWSVSEPLRALVEAFGGTAGLFEGDAAVRLRRLDEFSDRWDSRRGLERHQAAALELTADQEASAWAGARALGLTQPWTPRRPSYDHVIVLGGHVRACLVRAAHAAELLRSNAVRTPEVTALGGHRPFRGDEHALARRAGLPHVAGEYEALDAAMRRAFALGAPTAQETEVSDLPGGTWSLREYTDSTGLQVRVAAAPSSVPAERRADTVDAYGWFARHLVTMDPGQTLLAVTTSIYVPAQQAAALRMLALPFGVEVETVGVTPGDVLPELAQTYTATNYLQEIRSTIRGYRSLLSAVTSS